MMNFIRLIMYNSHTNESLKYFRATLNNIDRLKNVFIKSRFINRRIKRRHFNFSKFHVMIHYEQCIKYFESVVEMNNSYDENAHKFIIKNFYARINRNRDFNEQILFYNIRRHNILVMNDVLLHAWFRSITTTNKKKTFLINSMSKNSIKLQIWKLIDSNHDDFRILKFNYKVSHSYAWIKVRNLQKVLNIDNLSRVIIAFIRDKQANIILRSQIDNRISQHH